MGGVLPGTPQPALPGTPGWTEGSVGSALQSPPEFLTAKKQAQLTLPHLPDDT